MKIFPPISEMLWPPGLSPWQVAWHHRYAVLALLGGALFMSASNQPSQTSRLASKSILVPTTSCSTLEFDRLANTTIMRPCRSDRMLIGASIGTNTALQPRKLLSRSHQLTAADRAITRPPKLKNSVFERARPAGVPIYAPEPTLALTPSIR